MAFVFSEVGNRFDSTEIKPGLLKSCRIWPGPKFALSKKIMWKIIIAVLAALYALWPFDLLNDFIIGVGWIDDILLILAVWWFFFSKPGKSPQGFWQFYRQYDRRRQARESGEGREGGEHRRTGREAAGGKDPYTLLGVEPGASDEEIKKGAWF